MPSAQESWIESHPYLRNVAEFQQAVAESFTALIPQPVVPPEWKGVFERYGEGVPLLATPPAELDYAAVAGELLEAGCAQLVRRTLPEAVAASANALHQHLQASQTNCTTAIEWVRSGTAENAPPAAGLLCLLGWTAMRRTLAPVLTGFAEQRKDDGWMRAWCPVCGALPVLAHLTPEGGQPRMLACCYCRTSWQYRRIGCPFCENDDQNQLAVFTIEQEPLFRLDACRACNGYLKTYTGIADLELHLSDWSTLHLDILAQQNQLERKGASLYEI